MDQSVLQTITLIGIAVIAIYFRLPQNIIKYGYYIIVCFVFFQAGIFMYNHFDSVKKKTDQTIEFCDPVIQKTKKISIELGVFRKKTFFEKVKYKTKTFFLWICESFKSFLSYIGVKIGKKTIDYVIGIAVPVVIIYFFGNQIYKWKNRYTLQSPSSQ